MGGKQKGRGEITRSTGKEESSPGGKMRSRADSNISGCPTVLLNCWGGELTTRSWHPRLQICIPPNGSHRPGGGQQPCDTATRIVIIASA